MNPVQHPNSSTTNAATPAREAGEVGFRKGRRRRGGRRGLQGDVLCSPKSSMTFRWEFPAIFASQLSGKWWMLSMLSQFSIFLGTSQILEHGFLAVIQWFQNWWKPPTKVYELRFFEIRYEKDISGWAPHYLRESRPNAGTWGTIKQGDFIMLNSHE